MNDIKIEKNSIEARLTREESERISILKVWMAIMIVVFHAYMGPSEFFSNDNKLPLPAWLSYLEYFLSRSVTQFVVPGYAFLSAFFLYKKPVRFWNNLSKRFRGLVIPYFILNSFWIIFLFLLKQIPLFSPFFSNMKTLEAWDFSDWVHAYFGSPSNYFPMLGPLWFLRDLFVVNLFAVPIEKLVSRFPIPVLIINTVILLAFKSTNIFFLDQQVLCFWIYGCYFVKANYSFSQIDQIKKIPTLIIYLVLCIISAFLRNNTGNILQVVNKLISVFGFSFFYACCTDIKNSRFRAWLLRLSGYTFCVYLFHELNLSALLRVIKTLLPATAAAQIFIYIFAPTVITCFCFLFSILLKQFCPGVFSVITGNRKR